MNKCAEQLDIDSTILSSLLDIYPTADGGNVGDDNYHDENDQNDDNGGDNNGDDDEDDEDDEGGDDEDDEDDEDAKRASNTKRARGYGKNSRRGKGAKKRGKKQ